MLRQLAVFMASLFVPVSLVAAPAMPITYTINSPLVVSDDPYQVRVYQTEKLAVARQAPASQDDFYQKAMMSGTPDWSMPGTWIAGEKTAGRLAKMQNLGRTMYVRRELASLEEGKPYRDDTRDEIEWQINNLTVSFERGSQDRKVAGLAAKHFVLSVSYDYTQTDHSDGEQKKKTPKIQRHFWFAEALPFSPVQLLPLHLTNNTFADLAPDRINEAIYGRLSGQLQNHGMLVRSQMEMGGKTWTMEVANLESAEPLDLTELNGFPIVPEEQADNVIGALFLSRMLQGNLPEGGAFDVKIAGQEKEAERAKGQSAFTVSDDGDLGIAATFTLENGDEGLLLIMRPWHGAPEKGKHSIVTRRSRDEIKAMSQQELKQYAKGIQVFGLIDGDSRLIALSSGQAGHVTLKESGKNLIGGDFEIDMTAVDVGGSGTIGEQTLKGSFQAVSGLDVRLRNAVTRRLK